MANKEFIKRLENEEDELNDKIIKLDSFMNSSGFTNIPYIQQTLLIIQLDAMRTYSSVLNARLDDLVDEPE